MPYTNKYKDYDLKLKFSNQVLKDGLNLLNKQKLAEKKEEAKTLDDIIFSESNPIFTSIEHIEKNMVPFPINENINQVVKATTQEYLLDLFLYLIHIYFVLILISGLVMLCSWFLVNPSISKH